MRSNKREFSKNNNSRSNSVDYKEKKSKYFNKTNEKRLINYQNHFENTKKNKITDKFEMYRNEFDDEKEEGEVILDEANNKNNLNIFKNEFNNNKTEINSRIMFVPKYKRLQHDQEQNINYKNIEDQREKYKIDDTYEEPNLNNSLTSGEINQIKNKYLGMNKIRKVMQKPSEKFRTTFNFDWNADDDTTKYEDNPLYKNKEEPKFLFGRGLRAGIDIKEQKRKNNSYNDISKDFIDDSNGSEEDSLHWSKKNWENMNDRDWKIFREDFEIYIKGGKIPKPIRNWEESDLPLELLDAIKKAGYEKPTPIQMQGIPIALKQRDLIGIAETGSGKTAAFILPLLSYVSKLPLLNEETCVDGPYSVILAPSRELAIQILTETKKFSINYQLRCLAVVGGRSAEEQAFELRNGVEIVIATPGRLKDCLDRSYTVMNQCYYIIIDEADRMIDLGFEESLNFILDKIPNSNLKDEHILQELEAKAGYRKYRLTQMFSATMPACVERIGRKYLRQPIYMSIGDPGAGKQSIEQRLIFITEGKKKQKLHEVLEEIEFPCIIFTNQKKVTDVLAKQLNKFGLSAVSLHGGKQQQQRESNLEAFKQRLCDILVATDVAGRGIDVQGVKTVINFDMPKEIEPYTHRIGRTGRMGKRGLAISFITEEDSNIFFDLKNLLISTNNIVPLELAQHPSSRVKQGVITQLIR